MTAIQPVQKKQKMIAKIAAAHHHSCMEKEPELISGIQQVGIGVKNVHTAKHLYKKIFGMDVLVFEDQAEAVLMSHYTGNKVHSRHAVLSINMAGGGGFEIWQYESKEPVRPAFQPMFGDLGIFGAKLKCNDIHAAYQKLQQSPLLILSPLFTAPSGAAHFWATDEWGNHFNIVNGNHWFRRTTGHTGGVIGAVIGVSNMDKAFSLYHDVLGIREIVYDQTGIFEDLPKDSYSQAHYRRVLLCKPAARTGAFSKLLGDIQIELVQCLDLPPKKIFENRHWGDCGFIHLCFDVLHMDALKELAQQKGFSFTVDSTDSFSMGSSAGRFCYLEDADGTLIELVETHKVPILKKLGWYFDLKKRKKQKPLPDWMIRLLSLSRVK